MDGWCRLLCQALIVYGCFACTQKEKDLNLRAPAEQPVGLPEKGKPLFVACQACHGEVAQGNVQWHAPALANLDEDYLYQQLMNFKRGVRGYLAHDTLGLQMAAASGALADSAAVRHIAAYIRTLPEVKIQYAIAGDSKKGERTYQSICGSCHGPQGKGNRAMHAPRLNGLDGGYLKRQIVNFQNGTRGAHPQDLYGAQMVSMAALLKDDESIDDVIAYLLSPAAKPETP